MPLAALNPIGFLPTNNPEAARSFYEQLLGLTFVADDGFALVFRIGPSNTMLRIARTGEFTPAPYTIFGWEVEALEATIAELTSKGIEFLRFSFFKQDAQGIWHAPGGAKVAWFKDPDGNTLSLSYHPT